MFLTSFLLVKYWLYNKEVIQYFSKDHKNLKKILFFGIGSAVALTIHSIFLGIRFDYDLYKFFRRFVLLSFIIRRFIYVNNVLFFLSRNNNNVGQLKKRH